MLPNFSKRRRLVVLLAVLGVVALVLVGRWLNATKIGGQQPAEPFRIAGNFYYSDASADSLASGGDDPDAVLPLRALIWIGVLGYPPPRVDHRACDLGVLATSRYPGQAADRERSIRVLRGLAADI